MTALGFCAPRACSSDARSALAPPPPSSNVSAEIFVVCRDFLAPAYIDPKFLDPKHVFKDLSALVAGAERGTSAANVQANVFAPEKKRRQREGYEEGNYTLFKEIGVAEFIQSSDPITVLGSVNRMTFREPEERKWLKSEHTTVDVKANLDDLKLLGKGDFKTLMKWRIAIREEAGLDVKVKAGAEATEKSPEPEKDEDEQIEEEVRRFRLHPFDHTVRLRVADLARSPFPPPQLERLTESQQRKARQARRKAQEKKMRAVVRMQLRMAAPNIGALEAQDGALAGEDAFDLGEGERGIKGRRTNLADALGDEGLELSSDSEDDGAASDATEEFLDSEDEREAKTLSLENEMENLYGEYQSHMQDKDAKFRVKEARRKDKTRESWKGIDEDKGSDDESDDEDANEEGGWDNKEKNRAAIGEIDSSDDDSDDEDGMEAEGGAAGPRRSSRGGGNLLQKLDDGSEISTAAKVWFDQAVFDGLDEFEDEEEAEMTDGEDESADEDEDEAEEPVAAGQMSDSEVRPHSPSASPSPSRALLLTSPPPDLPRSAGRLGRLRDRARSPRRRGDGPLGRRRREHRRQEEEACAGCVPPLLCSRSCRPSRPTLTPRRPPPTPLADRGLITAEAITLASQLVNREKTLSQLVDDGFNRHAFDSKDDLPAWFLDDESKNYKSNVPISKEAVEQLRAKQRALDARPIRKVAEAKARKQRRAIARVDKALKKADGLLKCVLRSPVLLPASRPGTDASTCPSPAATTTSPSGRRPARSRRSCARVSPRTSTSRSRSSSPAAPTEASRAGPRVSRDATRCSYVPCPSPRPPHPPSPRPSH